jgi:TonB family protein
MTMLRGMTAVLIVLLAGCGGGGASAPACTTPDRAPHVVNQAQPVSPALAQQQGIAGDVVVQVTFDGSGSVIATSIVSSPSAVLNQAALSAARSSTYQPGLVNCKPGGTVSVTFHFELVPIVIPTFSPV